MILPVKEGARECAACTCDICGAKRVIPAMHGTSLHGVNGRRGNWAPLKNEGVVLKKLQADGWAKIGKILRCPTCELERKTPKESDIVVNIKDSIPLLKPAIVSTVEDIRQPTREQKREIIAMLESVYDSKAGMYSGHETDQSVSQVMGGGIMPGWVAAIREDLFGPSGGNGEMEALKSSLKVHIAKCEVAEKNMIATAALYQADVDASKKLLARLEAIKAAVGPKAVRA